ncbi:MAG: hypothetical protein E6Q28_15645 [Afipia sp.]|nr:MAG: hypothetical protein E6Q28_15645 [Afipia sp.]
MKKVSIFAAAAAVTALVTAPALAQDTAKPSSEMQGKSAKSIKHMKHSSKHTRHMRHSARIQNRDGASMRTAAGDWGDRANWNGRDNWNDRNWGNRNSGFWPADVVGGAVGTAGAIAAGAVNTAGAIATAPFGGPYRDRYAYRDTYAFGGPEYAYGRPEYAASYNYDGVAIAYSPNYAARNGFVCQPGTMFKNKAGQMQICQ